jgi:hypothetical protein
MFQRNLLPPISGQNNKNHLSLNVIIKDNISYFVYGLFNAAEKLDISRCKEE